MNRNLSFTIDLASRTQLCLKPVRCHQTCLPHTVNRTAIIEVFLNIARQFILPPQVIGLLVQPPLICVLVILCWLTPAPTFADSTTDTPAKPGSPTLSITDADCIDFINENPRRVRCGFIDLPVNHDTPDKGTVTLPILIAGQTQSLSDRASEKAILIPCLLYTSPSPRDS